MAKAKRHFRLSAELLECRQMLALDPTFGNNGFTLSTLGEDERSTTMGFLLDPGGGNTPLLTVLGGYQINQSLRFPDSAQPELVFFTPDGQIAAGIGINGVRSAPVGLGDSRIAGIDSYRQNGITYIVAAGYTEVSGDDLNYVPGLDLSPGNGFAVFANGRDFFVEDIGTTIEILENTAGWEPGEYTIRDVQTFTPPGGNPVGVAFLNEQLVQDPLLSIGGGVWMIQDPVNPNRPSTDFLVSRYRLVGGQVALDPTWGVPGINTGHVIIPIASGVNSRDIGYAVSVDQQNRTVVAGYSQNANGDYDFSVIRLLNDGRLDPGFVFTGQPGGTVASPGRVQIDIDSDDFADAVDVNADGDIMIAGSSNGDRQPLSTFVKLTTTGVLDITFDGATNGNGIVVLPRGTAGNGFINDIEEYPVGAADGLGGFYVATGTNTGTNKGTILLRINDETGQLDTSFRGSGIQRMNLSSSGDDWGNSVDLQPTAIANTFGIVMGGSIEVSNEGFNMYVARFESDGTPDTTFNNGDFLFILPIQDDVTDDRDEYGATLFVSPYPATPNRILISGSAAISAADQFDFVLAAVLGVPSPQAPAIVNAVSRSIVEGDGTTTMTIQLTLDTSESGPLTEPVTVNYATQNGTATAGTDYTAKTGSVTFNPGTTTRTVSVQVMGNTQYQANRWFSLNLTGANGADLGDATARVTIRDNDGTWQNVVTPEDADADGDVEPNDILRVIDDVNRNGIRQLFQATSTPALFADVTGDTLVTPADVLAIIDRVNRSAFGLQSSIQSSDTTTGSGFLSSVESSSDLTNSSATSSAEVAQGFSIVGVCPVGPYEVRPIKPTGIKVTGPLTGEVEPVCPPATDLALATYTSDLSDLGESEIADDAGDLYELIAGGMIS